AVFEFPEVKESAITAQESENVTLNFTLNKTNCVEDDFKDFNIEISKVGKDGNAGTYCSIRHRNGTCTNADRGCTCPGDDGSYQWSKIVDRKDNAKWVWQTSNKMTTKEEVLINVLSPPEIKIKTPEIEFVPGEDVKIEINVCTHTNDLLSCQLTMLSDSEKSRPPQMEMNNAEMNFNPDDDVYLEVNVRTHTKELLSCSLRMLSDYEKPRQEGAHCHKDQTEFCSSRQTTQVWIPTTCTCTKKLTMTPDSDPQ
ncbi:hypothetical protein BaRGS_00021566, partial [Batillaria attramentaria]